MKNDWKIILLLVLLQCALCIFAIDRFPISLDEPFSIYHAQFPLDEMVAEVQKGNNSPLHFVLLHFWIKLFGIGPVAVRSLSVIFSLISVVFLYKLARKFWKPNLAVIPPLLFMFSRLDHFVAMEARMYGLFTSLFILILYDLYRLLFENKQVYITLGIWNALLLYTHYLGGIVVLMECLVFVVFFKEITRTKLIQVSLTIGVCGLLFFPGINAFLNRASDFSQTGSWVPEAKFADLWVNLVKLFGNQFTLFVTCIIVSLLLIFLPKKERLYKTKEFKFFGIWFLGGYLLFFIMSHLIQPIFFIKYLQFLTIPLFFAIVGSLAILNPAGKQKFLPLLVLVPFLVSMKVVPDINRNTDELVTFIKSNQTTETTIYYCPPHYGLTLAYHYDRDIFADFRQTDQRLKESGFFPIYDASGLESDKNEIIYVDFDSKLLYPDNGILDALNEEFSFVNSARFSGNFNVYIFRKS